MKETKSLIKNDWSDSKNNYSTLRGIIMTVGIKADFLWFPIGTGDFFHSFFSTICVNLEGMSWGKRFQ